MLTSKRAKPVDRDGQGELKTMNPPAGRVPAGDSQKDIARKTLDSGARVFFGCTSEPSLKVPRSLSLLV